MTMGSACCVATKERNIPDRLSYEIEYGNVRYSPSWSVQWDNRRRVAGDVETSVSLSPNGVSRKNVLEIKSGTNNFSANGSEVRSPVQRLQTTTLQKSPVSDGTAGKWIGPASDHPSFSRDVSSKAKELTECPETANLSSINLSPSTSSVFASNMSSRSHMLPAGSTPSRWPNHSPRHLLFQGLNSPNSFIISEENPSSVLPAWSNESTRVSHGGSSDSWSLHAFYELMVNSQRERRSFDSEPLSEKMTLSSSRVSASPSLDIQTCGVCLRLLTEKSVWSGQKIFVSNELSVIAVLICGHVYHADCLEKMTPEINKYDPSCPVCTLGEKQTQKLCEKALKAEIELKVKASKRSKNRVVDSDFDGDFIKLDHRKNNGIYRKGLKMCSSSSMRASFGKPFLKRHFSFGSKSTKSITAKKKGFFWTKSSQE